jgi:AraC-like DNA-binding protein
LRFTSGTGDHQAALTKEAGFGGVMRVDHRREDFLYGLPVSVSEAVQLGTGRVEYRSRRNVGRHLSLIYYQVAPEMAVHSAWDKDWAALLLPLNQGEALVYNGRQTRAFELVFAGECNDYFTMGKERCNIAILIRRSRINAACAAMAGVHEEDVKLTALALPRQQVLGRSLYRALVSAVVQPPEEPLTDQQLPMAETLENDLTCLLASQLAPIFCRRSIGSHYKPDTLRVVHAAIDASRAQPTLSLDDMCAAANVSQRWLHKCFLEVYGMSPYRYIKLARLAKAREMLLASEHKPALVKSVSLSMGYRVSGRFAAEYRCIYGENPSETLLRS